MAPGPQAITLAIWMMGLWKWHLSQTCRLMLPPKRERSRMRSVMANIFAFTGPLNDNEGNQVLADGEVADRQHLDTMMYYVEGIDAKVPN
jgi:hypothetical protein